MVSADIMQVIIGYQIIGKIYIRTSLSSAVSPFDINQYLRFYLMPTAAAVMNAFPPPLQEASININCVQPLQQYKLFQIVQHLSLL